MIRKRLLTDSLGCRQFTIPGAAVLAPINTGFATNGIPDSRLLAFHRARAGIGVGIAFVGNVATDLNVRTNLGTTVLADQTAVPAFRAIADAIRGRGTLPAIQLGDAPDWLAPQRNWRTRSVENEVARLRTLLCSAAAGDLQAVLDRFVHSVKLAAIAGFAVVEIHAAHGYMLSLLLEPQTNQRTDKFSVEGGWLAELCQAARAAIGENALLAFRISGILGTGRERAEDVALAVFNSHRLIDNGVDIIDISAGIYTVDRQLIYPKQDRGPAYLDVAASIAAQFKNPIIVSGGIRDLGVISSLPPNVLIGLGRPFLADPEVIAKTVDGRLALIVPCCNAGQCHFTTRNAPSIACGQNPSLEESGE